MENQKNGSELSRLGLGCGRMSNANRSVRIENAIPKDEIGGASFPEMKFKNGIVVR